MARYVVVGVAVAFLLAAVHFFGERATGVGRIPRSRWLAFASGVSVAYVFVHLLPEVEEASEALEPHTGPPVAFLDHHPFLLALAGFVVFYGLERYAKRGSDDGEENERQVFWTHVGSFTAYNAVIGYLLVSRYGDDLTGMALFAVAIGLHFVVNDHGLREHHGERYHEYGRWLVATAVVLGSVAGVVLSLGEVVVLPLLAFLAGSVVLNVVKEELPEQRESRFSAFAVGVVGYTTVLVFG